MEISQKIITSMLKSIFVFYVFFIIWFFAFCCGFCIRFRWKTRYASTKTRRFSLRSVWCWNMWQRQKWNRPVEHDEHIHYTCTYTHTHTHMVLYKSKIPEVKFTMILYMRCLRPTFYFSFFFIPWWLHIFDKLHDMFISVNWMQSLSWSSSPCIWKWYWIITFA